jgi:hypothetical protein
VLGPDGDCFVVGLGTCCILLNIISEDDLHLLRRG